MAPSSLNGQPDEMTLPRLGPHLGPQDPGAVPDLRCYPSAVKASRLVVELEREEDGRWIAEAPSLPGVLTYGQSHEEALARVEALALRVLAERAA